MLQIQRYILLKKVAILNELIQQLTRLNKKNHSLIEDVKRELRFLEELINADKV